MVLKAGRFQIKSLTESKDSQRFSAQLIQESVHLKLKLPGPEFSEMINMITCLIQIPRASSNFPDISKLSNKFHFGY